VITLTHETVNRAKAYTTKTYNANVQNSS